MHRFKIVVGTYLALVAMYFLPSNSGPVDIILGIGQLAVGILFIVQGIRGRRAQGAEHHTAGSQTQATTSPSPHSR